MGKQQLKAIDLFAGAGGLSQGFISAGWNVSVAIEKDLWAAETLAKNHLSTKVIKKNISEISDDELKEQGSFDLVMGGPPCQGFSISASNRRRQDDPRNSLYLEMIRAAKVFNPRVVLIENVPEIKKFVLPSGRLLMDDIKDRLRELGYSSWCFEANSSWFGVPQSRKRAFVFSFKSPEQLSKFKSKLTKYVPFENPSLFTHQRAQYLSLWEAISDLPEVKPREFTENSTQNYLTAPNNSFQQKMRSNNVVLKNHVPMNHTLRMVERFKFIQNTNDQAWDETIEHAPRRRSKSSERSEKKFHQNHRKLDPNNPAPTITASFYSSFIHPRQPRNLTVREAARLQTFPDSFIFYGKRTTLSKKLLQKKGIFEDLHLDQFNQVGNAVPPLQASIFAQLIQGVIEE